MTQTAYAKALDILADAQDIAVLSGSVLGSNMRTYAVKASLQAQKQLYLESVVDESEKEIPAFQGHWQFDDKKGITGSDTFLTLRFDQRALRPRGLWVPGILEAKALEAQGKLENEVYRDYCNALYSAEGLNQEIAKVLATQAQDQGLELPLLAPFRSLSYTVDASSKAVAISLGNVQAVIQGSKAQEELAKLNSKGNSDIRRLFRDWFGLWSAHWINLTTSKASGRVDWFCGEIDRESLLQAHKFLLERKYGEAMRKEQRAFEEAWNKPEYQIKHGTTK